ncbi:YrhK-like protein [Saccharopolyspora erythraea NRRL 2338]|uniref:YrhK family protein n=1 Tax=Saccharopolyspora erythraea TaxID=1836 RepID=A0ABN1C9S1_SACER|nr:YrhK family protein [Saccharopolyspora erythraea]PFG96177.1 YrhK-like protein [Saccharopolyspora erythraea NRRL 2338]QRK92710.1 YrhK family protein [Saccharopolyspora erythraea]
MTDPAASTPWVRRIGHGELLLRHRYEMASIVNDILIAFWFIVGSLLFFSPLTTTAGVWMFLLGSIELAIRPSIRLVRHLHLRKVQKSIEHESDQDF